MSKREFIEVTIKDNKVVVFSKTWCPSCKKTLDLLNSLKANPFVIELDKRDDESELQDILKTMTGARTVPRVFIGGDSIGGNDETQALHSSGELVPRLKSVGAL